MNTSENRSGTSGRRQAGGAGTALLGLLFGALAGGITALLLAPRSGKETQEYLRDRSDSLRMEAEQRLVDGRQQATDRVRQARMTVAEWLDQGSSLLGDQAERIRDNEIEDTIAAR